MSESPQSRILIVSADGGTSEQAVTALPEAMYEVQVAADATQALERAGSIDENWDVVLLDRSLTDGIDGLYERYLDLARTSEVPLLVLGPDAPPSDWGRLLHEGASAYVTLPLDGDALGAQVAVALRTKERYDQLRAQAVIDELTGVYNRRYLDEQLGSRLAEAQRYNSPFSIGLLDIDHFKRVNDTYGHPVGDEVLAQTASVVRRQMRKEDLLARYGGEEFAMLLPHTDRLGAAILAERVREAIADHPYEVSSGESIRITISLGLASFPLDAAETDLDLLKIADRRLYQAKDDGRNVTVFE